MRTVTKRCMLCGKESSLKLTADMYAKYEEYLAGHIYIQEIPLPADQREFLMTGMCEDCQHMMFDEEEDEE